MLKVRSDDWKSIQYDFACFMRNEKTRGRKPRSRDESTTTHEEGGHSKYVARIEHIKHMAKCRFMKISPATTYRFSFCGSIVPIIPCAAQSSVLDQVKARFQIDTLLSKTSSVQSCQPCVVETNDWDEATVKRLRSSYSIGKENRIRPHRPPLDSLYVQRDRVRP